MGWGGIARLCLVNAAIGGMAALPVNLFNRLMTVELSWPALLPGLLVALHYAVQISRPAWGHRSDATGRPVRVILGGMGILALGVVAAAWAVGLPPMMALTVWIMAYVAIGLGIGAAGTSFLALLSTSTPPSRRPAAATLAWLMLIAGAIVTSISTGIAIEPFAPGRLTFVVSCAALGMVLLTVLATFGQERPTSRPTPAPPLRHALSEAWADAGARRFTGFVFLSILAFYLSELIFEPFAGHVHGLSPSASTQLSGAKDGAALLGMLAAGALSSFRIGDLRAWAIVGCIVSAIGLFALGAQAPLMLSTLVLGLGNGLFVVGAIGSMMRLAATREGAEGTTMGVFGAAQAIAAGLAGILATAMLDLMRLAVPDGTAYATLFAIEAILFIAAALLAARILGPAPAIVPGE